MILSGRGGAKIHYRTGADEGYPPRVMTSCKRYYPVKYATDDQELVTCPHCLRALSERKTS